MHFFFAQKEEKNQDLIEQIILENYNCYYRLAYSYVHNEEDAGDIVQNGAYRALKGSHTLKHPEYAQSWVYRIMLNECFRYLKQPKFLSYEAVQEEKGFDMGYTEDRYMNIDLMQAKAVVILRFFEDKKLEEIADILEENVNTVKSRLYRSMKKLRNTLAADSDEYTYPLNAGKEAQHDL